MYSDNETRTDLLGFDDQVEDLVAVVMDPGMLPVTVGVLGDWGSGKSSLLRMAAERLRAAGALVIEFTPWRIENYDDAKTAMLTAVVDEIAAETPVAGGDDQDPSRYDRARQAVGRLRRRVRWMRVAGLAAKHVVTMSAPTLDDLDGLLRPEDGDDEDQGTPSTESVSRDFRAEFEDLVAAVGRPVVVLVDDLDRCLPPQVLDVLQAIRLFLAVEGTAFVLATDERVVKDAVRLRYPQASAAETDLPQEYLEKIVQVPLRIPPLGAAEAESYLNLLVAQAHLDAADLGACREKARAVRSRGAVSVAMNLGLAREAVSGPLPAAAEREFELMGRIARPLASGLKGNPRQIKRYLNAFEMRRRTAARRGLEDAVDDAVLAKLMVLEYAKPVRLQELNRWQAEENGRPVRLAAIEAAVVPPPPVPEQPAAERDGDRPPRRTVAPRRPDLAAEDRIWTEDPWLAGWVGMEPRLAEVDLRPYLELARAALPALAVRARALPERLQALLEKLASPTAEVREAASTTAAGLPPEDVAALVEAAADRLPTLPDPGQLALSLGEVAARHPGELAGVMSALRAMPHGPLRAALPMQLANRLAGEAAARPLSELFGQWAAQEGNATLQTAARQALQGLR